MVVGCATVTLVACGGDDEPTVASLVDIPETVAIGRMPEPLSDVATLPTPPPPPTTAPTSSSTTQPNGPTGEVVEGALGESVQGRRVILIGDEHEEQEQPPSWDDPPSWEEPPARSRPRRDQR